LSQADYGLQNHNGILVSNFKGASYNFEFDYLINKETNNGKKPPAKVPI
jgi:hypothetical protein